MKRSISLGFYLLTSILALFLVFQPVGTDTQWAIAGMCLAVMLAIKLLNLQGYWRHLFFALAALLVLRYVYWRTTRTLPDANVSGLLHPRRHSLRCGNVLHFHAGPSASSSFPTRSAADRTVDPGRQDLPTSMCSSPPITRDKAILSLTFPQPRQWIIRRTSLRSTCWMTAERTRRSTIPIH